MDNTIEIEQIEDENQTETYSEIRPFNPALPLNMSINELISNITNAVRDKSGVEKTIYPEELPEYINKINVGIQFMISTQEEVKNWIKAFYITALTDQHIKTATCYILKDISLNIDLGEDTDTGIVGKIYQNTLKKGDIWEINNNNFELQKLYSNAYFHIIDKTDYTQTAGYKPTQKIIPFKSNDKQYVFSYKWVGAEDSTCSASWWLESDNYGERLLKKDDTELTSNEEIYFYLSYTDLNEYLGELNGNKPQTVTLKLVLENNKNGIISTYEWTILYTQENIEYITVNTNPKHEYINIGPLFPDSKTLRDYGCFFSLIFETSNVNNINAIIGEHQEQTSSTKLGIELGVRGLKLITPTTTKLVPYCENERIELMVNIGKYKPDLYEKTKDKEHPITLDDLKGEEYSTFPNLATVWLNGIPSLIFELQEHDYKSNNSDFWIGSEDADINLINYNTHIIYKSEGLSNNDKNYHNAQNSEAILKEYIAWGVELADGSEEELNNGQSRRDLNNQWLPSLGNNNSNIKTILNDNLNLQNLINEYKDLHILEIILPDGAHMTENKKDSITCDIKHYLQRTGENGSENFELQNVTMKAQGTSSLDYKDGALNLDLDCGDAEYKNENSWNYSGEFKNYGYSQIKDGIPTTYFNIKLNVASSDNVNNTLFADEYNQYNGAENHSLTRKLDNRIRDTIAGEPCIIFITNNTGTNINISSHLNIPNGTTIFYGIGDINNSKKNFEVLGQQYKDKLTTSISHSNENNRPFQFSNNITYQKGDYCYYDSSPNENSYGCKWDNNVYYCIENYANGQTGWDCTKWVSVYNNNCNPWDKKGKTAYQKNDLVTYIPKGAKSANYYKCISESPTPKGENAPKPTNTTYFEQINSGNYPQIIKWEPTIDIENYTSSNNTIYKYYGYYWKYMNNSIEVISNTKYSKINDNNGNWTLQISSNGENLNGELIRENNICYQIRAVENNSQLYDVVQMTFPAQLPSESYDDYKERGYKDNYFKRINFIYPEWEPNKFYDLHDFVTYHGRPYRCINSTNIIYFIQENGIIQNDLSESIYQIDLEDGSIYNINDNMEIDDPVYIILDNKIFSADENIDYDNNENIIYYIVDDKYIIEAQAQFNPSNWIPITDVCCIEIGNNSSLQCNFQNDNLDTADWSGDDISGLGGRFPDEHITNSMKFALQNMLTWLVSTYCVDRNDINKGSRESKSGITINGETGDSDTMKLYRFYNELSNYFTVDSLLFHYLFTEYHCMVDNRAKNCFITYEWDKNYDGLDNDGFRWNYYKDYDNDTADGNDNSGGLEYTYGMTDLTRDSGDVFVFNSAQNTLWWNLRECFQEELAAYYQNNLYSSNEEDNKCFNAKRLINKFKNYQLKRTEAAYIEDAWTKYIMPLYCLGNSMYLPKALGTKEQQRKLFETYQKKFMDSKYTDPVTKKIVIQFRIGEASIGSSILKNGNLYLTPYATQYITAQYDSTQTKVLAKENQVTELAPEGSEYFKDTNVNIFDADNIIEFNNGTSLYIGGATLNIKDAEKLQKIELGKHDLKNQYINNRSFNITNWLNNNNLTYLDLTGFQNLDFNCLDLSKHTNIKEIYLDKTNLVKLIIGKAIGESEEVEEFDKNLLEKNIYICELSSENLRELYLENVYINKLYFGETLIISIDQLESLGLDEIIIKNSQIGNISIDELEVKNNE